MDKKQLLGRIEQAIKRYKLIPKEGPVIFALSDGGDSRALLDMLTGLGYKEQILPVVIDMGYEDFDSSKAKIAAKKLGYSPVIINVTNKEFQKHLDDTTLNELKSNIKEIKNINLDEDLTASRCTRCYNSKRIALDFIAENTTIFEVARPSQNKDSSTIIFGHHMDDSIESLLKERFYRLHYAQGATYSRPEFRKFIRKLKENNSLPQIYKELELLVEQKQYSTDEPIQETKKGIKIVRPLVAAGIYKQDIDEYRLAEGINDVRSGCPHSDNPAYHTGREIIRDEIGNYLDIKTRNYLANLVMKGLNADGTRITDIRRKNDLKDYKTARKEITKK